jgi:hypothetical protein
MTRLWADAAGWLGATLLLSAYGLVSFKRMRPDSVMYQLLNAVGSALLIVNTVFYRAYPSAFVNVVWIFIAAISFARFRIHARSDGKM